MDDYVVRLSPISHPIGSACHNALQIACLLFASQAANAANLMQH